MLRRFEIYSIDQDAPPDKLELLRRSCRDCPSHIPEVLYSAVGDNVTSLPVNLAWEHAYESPESYRRYMVHPFHASVLDRFLLADSPERIMTPGGFGMGLGLAGYSCDGPVFALDSGIRRLVFLDLGSATEGQRADVAAAAAQACGGPSPQMSVSVFAENTLATRWFDGETVTAPAPRWTHIWEQGFADEAGYEAHVASGGLLADAERDDRQAVPGVREVAVVRYRIEPATAD